MGTYEIIKSYLNNPKQDSTFSPKMLDDLSTKERLTVEYEIAMYCQKGCQQYFKFIPYFRVINIEEFMSLDVLNALSPADKMEAIKNLFLRTKSSSYLKEFAITAIESPLAFNTLLNLAADERLSIEEREKIKAIVEKVYNKNQLDINYKTIMDLKKYSNDERTISK